MAGASSMKNIIIFLVEENEVINTSQKELPQF